MITVLHRGGPANDYGIIFSILWQNLNGKDGGLELVEVWFAQNSRQTSQYIALQLTDSIKGKKEKNILYFFIPFMC